MHGGRVGHHPEPGVRRREVRHLSKDDVRAKHREVLADGGPGMEHQRQHRRRSSVGLLDIRGRRSRNLREEHARLAAVPDARREHLERRDAHVVRHALRLRRQRGGGEPGEPREHLARADDFVKARIRGAQRQLIARDDAHGRTEGVGHHHLHEVSDVLSAKHRSREGRRAHFAVIDRKLVIRVSHDGAERVDPRRARAASSAAPLLPVGTLRVLPGLKHHGLG